MKTLLSLILIFLYIPIYFNLKSILIRNGFIKLSKYEREINTVLTILVLLVFALINRW
jgi:hypothetical protein